MKLKIKFFQYIENCEKLRNDPQRMYFIIENLLKS